MEGQNNSALPEDKGSSKGSKTKLIAIVVVVILVIAAIGVAFMLLGGEDEDETAISFSADSEIIVAGESVEFDASASVGSDGKADSITGYGWQFGDGQNQTTTAGTAIHTYAYPGKYIVLLTVNEGDKATTGFKKYVTIEVTNDGANNITAIVSASNNVIKNNISIDFDASLSTATDGNITEFVWTFGDGTSGITGNLTEAGAVQHTFIGTNVLYASYVTLSSANYTQRYYNSVLMVAEGSASGDSKIFIRESIGGDPDTLDPAVDYETAGGEVLQNVYETLIWYDGGSAIDLKPMLATEVPTVANGLISEDGLNYTFNLRANVLMHDGTIMNAEDVEYSLERVLTINDPNGPAWMMGQVMVSNFDYGIELNATEIENSVEITDTMQVTIHLLKPYPAFIYVLAYTVASVVSMEYVEDNGGVDVLTTNDWMQKHTCGSGAYQLDVWQPGIQIVLRAHDNYWQGEPNLDIVVIKGVPSWGTRLIHLQAGVVQSIDVPRSQINAMAGVENIIISKGNATFSLDFLGMNWNITDPTVSGIDIGDIPSDFFTDKNVRMAFAYAFNYSLNIALNYKGTAVQPNGPVPSGMNGYDESIPNWDYNLSMAEVYLDEAINPDTGNSWLDDGFTINVYYNAENTVRLGACEILEDGLESLSPNIDVIPTGLTWSVYLGHLYGGDLPTFVLGWAVDYADADDFVQPLIKDGSTYGGPLGFDNDTLTQMVDDAAAEIDPETRLQLYSDIQWASYEECLYIWLAQATNFRVMLDSVIGYQFNPMYSAWYYYDIDLAE